MSIIGSVSKAVRVVLCGAAVASTLALQACGQPAAPAFSLGGRYEGYAVETLGTRYDVKEIYDKDTYLDVDASAKTVTMCIDGEKIEGTYEDGGTASSDPVTYTIHDPEIGDMKCDGTLNERTASLTLSFDMLGGMTLTFLKDGATPPFPVEPVSGASASASGSASASASGSASASTEASGSQSDTEGSGNGGSGDASSTQSAGTASGGGSTETE